MAQSIVDIFELIQVEIKQGTVGTATCHARNLALQFLLEEIAIGQAGQTVMLGLIGEFFFISFLLSDITRCPGNVDHTPLTVQLGASIKTQITTITVFVEVHSFVMKDFFPAHQLSMHGAITLSGFRGLKL